MKGLTYTTKIKWLLTRGMPLYKIDKNSHFTFLQGITRNGGIIVIIPSRGKVILKISSIMAIIIIMAKFPEWFIVEINVRFPCSNMSLPKMTGLDILTKHLTIDVFSSSPFKIDIRWIMKNCLTLEKQFSIIAG